MVRFQLLSQLENTRSLGSADLFVFSLLTTANLRPVAVDALDFKMVASSFLCTRQCSRKRSSVQIRNPFVSQAVSVLTSSLHVSQRRSSNGVRHHTVTVPVSRRFAEVTIVLVSQEARLVELTVPVTRETVIQVLPTSCGGREFWTMGPCREKKSYPTGSGPRSTADCRTYRRPGGGPIVVPLWRECPHKCGLVHPRDSWASAKEVRATSFPDQGRQFVFLWKMWAVAGGEKPTSLWHPQNPSTS